MKVEKGGKGTGDSMDEIINYASDRKLWAEVLKLAVLDLQEKDLPLKKAAFAFFKSDEPRFPSFISICKALDFAPDKIREQLFSKQVTKKSFQITLMRCCECGNQHPIDIMKKLEDLGMYICKRCQRALNREAN